MNSWKLSALLLFRVYKDIKHRQSNFSLLFFSRSPLIFVSPYTGIRRSLLVKLNKMNFVYKVLIFVFAILAVASASPAPSKTTSSAPPTQTGCSSGSLQCCQSLLPSSDSVVSILLGLLGIVLDSVTGLVGVTCSPINIVGITGVQW